MYTYMYSSTVFQNIFPLVFAFKTMFAYGVADVFLLLFKLIEHLFYLFSQKVNTSMVNKS